MTNNKYVVISDAHLGQDGKDGTGFKSILSDPQHPKFISFKEKILKFAGPDNITLIGVGDILDLSVSYMRDAILQLCGLVEEIEPINKIELIIGNHDHHLFTLCCEHQIVLDKMMWGYLPNPGSIYNTIHNVRSRALSMCLTSFTKRDIDVSLSYPILNKQIGAKLYTFTHGHLFGDLYTMISNILTPELKGLDYSTAIATTNISVIEFIYWLLGETGCGMGADGIVEAVYTEAAKGKTSLINELITRAVDTLFPKGVVSWIPDRIEKWLIKKAAVLIASSLIKEPSAALLSSKDRYSDLTGTHNKENKWIELTKDITTNIFITGHTHKWDVWEENNKQHINLGSWLIEPNHPDPIGVILLIDEKETKPTLFCI